MLRRLPVPVLRALFFVIVFAIDVAVGVGLDGLVSVLRAALSAG